MKLHYYINCEIKNWTFVCSTKNRLFCRLPHSLQNKQLFVEYKRFFCRLFPSVNFYSFFSSFFLQIKFRNILISGKWKVLYWNIQFQTLNFKNSNFYVFSSSDPSVDDSLAIHPLSSSRIDICQVRDITIYIFYSDERHIQGGGVLQGLIPSPWIISRDFHV